MLPVLSRLSLKQKLFLSASLPMFILVLLAVLSATTLFKQYQDASSNVLTTNVTLGIENVIYELQKERGLSAGYLSSGGRAFKQRLEQQWLNTDRKFQELLQSSALEKTVETASNDAELFHALQNQLSKASLARQQLEIARQKVLELNTPEYFNFYSGLTQKLINFVSLLRFKSDNSYQVLVQSDLINMLKIQELAGQERGLVNSLLAAPTLEPDSFKQIAQVRGLLDNAITNAFSVMTPDNRNSFSELMDSQTKQLISSYRTQLQLQVNLVKQAELISDLFGYGGLSYNFNAYLTTLNPAYLSNFRENYSTLRVALENLNNNHNLTPIQQALVNSIEQTATNYQEYVTEAELTQLPTSGATLELQAQNTTLHDSLNQLQQQAPIIDSETWWNTATAGVDALHKINTQLTERMAYQNEVEKQQIRSYLYISIVAGLLFFGIVYLIGRCIGNNLINSVRSIVDDVEKLAKDPSLVLDLEVKGKDELAQIAVAVNQMVSERMKSKRALHQASAVFRHSAEGILVTDANNRIELVNPAFTKITGYSLEDVKGKTPNILNSAHHPQSFYQKLWQTLITKGSWEGEIWNKRKDGQIYPEYLKISAVKNSQNETIQHIGLFLDISNNKQYEQDLWYKTNYDSLTKLPNRHLFSSRLQQALDTAQNTDSQVAILFIDLDHFKFINELHGNAAGNKVLKQSAARLEAVLGPDDSIARIGGDEFVIIAPQTGSVGTELLAKKLSDALSKPFMIGNHETNISSSFGIAFYPEDGQDIETLLHNSETAMYQAKRDGRAHYQYFSPEMNVEMLERMHLEQRLRRAVKQSEFYLEYQPVIDMRNGAIISVEALIRWNDPEFGVISPQAFIPIAEEAGLIEPLGEWILHQALSDLAELHSQGLMLKMAINVSGRQCINSKDVSFYDILKDALSKHAICAKDLHIEITESMLIEDKPRCLQTLESIKQLGVDIYLDDFGTGYSALSYLTQCPISVIKIDKSFIDNVLNNPSDAKLIKAIVMMAQSLEMPLVAEGIETVEQWQFLHSLGCDYAQGYLMSRPLTKPQLVEFLQQAKPFQYLKLAPELSAV
ncbi:diguanylate cyclase/phosphodiesterase with PAS/PAC sensor(s) [Shewanella halifaxensis HAW-EB4]|uniref:Diguanylate cyclase/phosphodiesterase with PAS/PAC sensor(S) n=1 Tax=Shewanella halifaxensis (strain HAW-EB4) TaxID=458817 RepID=B0TMZ0_SHEHH|nr:EAL domain-containing protein [Shewanella halifaxensis]ABZ78728.1 diguanylate cyclase/phosphodiesterase with PAS/PAC sensor(s) [Shewanella halifaxensis HAW-EB4]